jgi:hypothetical protein
MKTGEIKIRLFNALMTMIDTYFSAPSMSEKFINSTLKILVKQNINKIDSMLDLFTDENGDINAEEIISEYAEMFDESGYVFNIKDYIENESVKKFIPDKALVIKREDVLSILT